MASITTGPSWLMNPPIVEPALMQMVDNTPEPERLVPDGNGLTFWQWWYVTKRLIQYRSDKVKVPWDDATILGLAYKDMLEEERKRDRTQARKINTNEAGNRGSNFFEVIDLTEDSPSIQQYVAPQHAPWSHRFAREPVAPLKLATQSGRVTQPRDIIRSPSANIAQKTGVASTLLEDNTIGIDQPVAAPLLKVPDASDAERSDDGQPQLDPDTVDLTTLNLSKCRPYRSIPVKAYVQDEWKKAIWDSVMLTHKEEMISDCLKFGWNEHDRIFVVQYFEQIAMIKGQERINEIFHKRKQTTNVQEYDELDPLRQFPASAILAIGETDGILVNGNKQGVPPVDFLLEDDRNLDLRDDITPTGPVGIQYPEWTAQIIGFKYNWEPLPVGTTLVDIIKNYPNHMFDAFLDGFLQRHVVPGAVSAILRDTKVNGFLHPGTNTPIETMSELCQVAGMYKVVEGKPVDDVNFLLKRFKQRENVVGLGKKIPVDVMKDFYHGSNNMLIRETGEGLAEGKCNYGNVADWLQRKIKEHGQKEANEQLKGQKAQKRKAQVQKRWTVHAGTDAREMATQRPERQSLPAQKSALADFGEGTEIIDDTSFGLDDEVELNNDQAHKMPTLPSETGSLHTQPNIDPSHAADPLRAPSQSAHAPSTTPNRSAPAFLPDKSLEGLQRARAPVNWEWPEHVIEDLANHIKDFMTDLMGQFTIVLREDVGYKSLEPERFEEAKDESFRQLVLGWYELHYGATGLKSLKSAKGQGNFVRQLLSCEAEKALKKDHQLSDAVSIGDAAARQRLEFRVEQEIRHMYLLIGAWVGSFILRLMEQDKSATIANLTSTMAKVQSDGVILENLAYKEIARGPYSDIRYPSFRGHFICDLLAYKAAGKIKQRDLTDVQYFGKWIELVDEQQRHFTALLNDDRALSELSDDLHESILADLHLQREQADRARKRGRERDVGLSMSAEDVHGNADQSRGGVGDRPSKRVKSSGAILDR